MVNSNIKNALDRAALVLRAYPQPRFEAEVLLASVLNRPRSWLKTHIDETLSATHRLKFWYYAQQRRRGTPVAYILGYQDWCGLKIGVNRHTLIPRDETETLMHHITETEGNPESILDIGTGSGCIALYLKTRYPKANITGLDISKRALKKARHNADNLNLKVQWQDSDLLQRIPKNARFDLIVANLPYVPTTLDYSFDIEAEPSTAIFSGTSGLKHYERLATEIKHKEISFTALWIEFLPLQKDAIKKIFSDYQVAFFGDVSGEPFFARIS